MFENLAGKMLETTLSLAIEILLPLALGYLVKLIHDKIQEVKASRNTKEFELARLVIQRLVRAAEQHGVIGTLKDVGAEKKQFVIDLAEKELAKRGIKIDLDILDALIEAECHEQFTSVEQELNDLFGVADGEEVE